MNNSDREFRKIKSLEFLYEVNGNGTIFRNTKSKKQSKIIIDYHHSKSGYCFTWVCIKKKVRRVSIAKVVAECWYGDKPEGYEIDHIDRNSKNNDYRNLRYVTKSEQMRNRDHTRIAAQGKKNLDAYRKTIMKPVALINAAGFYHAYESMTSAAKALAEHYGKGFDHMRSKLKARRKKVYDYDVIYLNVETGHARLTGQGTVQ